MIKGIFRVFSLAVVCVVAMMARQSCGAALVGGSIKDFSGSVMLTKTNAAGALLEATIETSSTTYYLVTNDVKEAVLASWAKLNDRYVDLKGETMQVNDRLSVKVFGNIKDVTPSLKGGILKLSRDRDGKVINKVSYKTPDDRSFKVVTNGLPERIMKDLPRFHEKNVDIEGTLSPAKSKVMDVKSIMLSLKQAKRK